MNVTEQQQPRRGKRRATRAKVVNYREQFEDDIDSDAEERALARPTKKAHIKKADVRTLTNQLSRPQLERFIIGLYKASPEVRSAFKVEYEKTLFLKRSREELPAMTASSRLGMLGVLPPEVLVNILQVMDFKTFKTMTTAVSPDLNSFHWIASLWRDIDTNEIPYVPLMDIIMPKIRSSMPKCIKHLTLVYKLYQIPRAEKLLSIAAREHELSGLTLEQGSAQMTPKRLEFIKKLLMENESFRQVKYFEILMPQTGFNQWFSFASLLELFAFWPQLRSLVVDVPNRNMDDSLTLENFRKFARGTSAGPTVRRMHNFITTLCFSANIGIPSEIIVQLGSLFPELEVGIFRNVTKISGLTEHANKCWSYYDFVPHMPRLRKLIIGLHGHFNTKDENRAVSALFFSIIHQSPNLIEFSYEQGSFRVPSKHMELFCSIKRWKKWRGICNQSVMKLLLQGWALEWDILTHKGFMFQVPNVKSVVVQDCVNIRNDDPVLLMKHGGSYDASVRNAAGEEAGPASL